MAVVVARALLGDALSGHRWPESAVSWALVQATDGGETVSPAWDGFLYRTGANADAVDFLQGHAFGGGSRERYIDISSLNLEATVARIPRIKDNGNSVRLHLIGNG